MMIFLPRVKARLRPRPAQGKSCPEPRKQLPMLSWRAALQVLEPQEAGLRMYYRLAAGPLQKYLQRLFEGQAAASKSQGQGAARSQGQSLEFAPEARQALALRASCEVFASQGWAGKNFQRTSEVQKTCLGWLQRKKKAAWARSPSSFFRKEISSREVRFSQQGKNYSCICSRKQPVVAPKAKAKVRKRQDHRDRTADLRDFLHSLEFLF